MTSAVIRYREVKGDSMEFEPILRLMELDLVPNDAEFLQGTIEWPERKLFVEGFWSLLQRRGVLCARFGDLYEFTDCRRPDNLFLRFIVAITGESHGADPDPGGDLPGRGETTPGAGPPA